MNTETKSLPRTDDVLEAKPIGNEKISTSFSLNSSKHSKFNDRKIEGRVKKRRSKSKMTRNSRKKNK